MPPGGHPVDLQGTLTLPFSMPTVSMTMMWTCCSHTSRQKSSSVFLSGPWVAMNSCGWV